jgi:hypothetical protein
MNTLRAIRNLVGTASMIFAAYIVLVSLKDARRYIRITSM